MSDFDKPKKRKQRRYLSEDEILQAIDAQHARIDQLKLEAVRQDWLIRNCAFESRRTGQGCYDHDHEGNRDALWRAIERIEKVKLPKLKQALSAFRTGLLPITEDRGVVLD